MNRSFASWIADSPGPAMLVTGLLGLLPLFGLGFAFFLPGAVPALVTLMRGPRVGLMVAAGWGYTYLVSVNSFQVVQVQGLTFSGPSAEWLMRVLSSPAPAIGFDFGLLPGVFVGSFIGAWVGRDLKLEGFTDGYGMRRYIAGAVLMGFGSMLAGGCAVGAGITGGAIFALTAWIARVGMWAGAGLTDRLLDGKPASQRMPSGLPAVTAP